jgi:hypothetical protein
LGQIDARDGETPLFCKQATGSSESTSDVEHAIAGPGTQELSDATDLREPGVQAIEGHQVARTTRDASAIPLGKAPHRRSVRPPTVGVAALEELVRLRGHSGRNPIMSA